MNGIECFIFRLYAGKEHSMPICSTDYLHKTKNKMKIKLILLIGLILCGWSKGVDAQGIKFSEGTWKEILEQAKKEKKLVFVDCYTEWCEPCKKMEQQIFSLKAVGNFFNKNFINVKMDMEKGEGPTILSTYKINAFPTLFFVNGEGAEVHRMVGGKTAAEFIKLGKAALTSKEVFPVDSVAQRQITLIGKEIPDFCYRDQNGEEVKFSSLKGKYVYIDMWATWCRPCCGEIPYMAELEKQFQGKNIHFVSLSCDKDLDAWKKKIETEKMGGIQLNSGGDPAFMKFFGIRGIPHFILLDQEGKIINPNMSRPSLDVTPEVLKRLKGI